MSKTGKNALKTCRIEMKAYHNSKRQNLLNVSLVSDMRCLIVVMKFDIIKVHRIVFFTILIEVAQWQRQKKQEKSMEAALWESANKLRGNVEPAEYKHVVLSLIFLKYASDRFEERRRELIDEGKGAYVDIVEFYTQKSIFYIPENSRWSMTSTRCGAK